MPRATDSGSPTGRDVSVLLRAWSHGDSKALDQLTPIVYDELRRLARGYLRGERRDHSLQTTGLVNEAFLRLVDHTRMEWQNRAHFFRVGAGHAAHPRGSRAAPEPQTRTRSPSRGARGGHDDRWRTSDRSGGAGRCAHVACRTRSQKAQVVEMRFFGGLSVEESAEVLGVSPVTVLRDWRTAKAWLYRELSSGNGDE